MPKVTKKANAKAAKAMVKALINYIDSTCAVDNPARLAALADYEKARDKWDLVKSN